MRPQGRVKIKWSPEFAYAIGLIATDGCLLKDRRHVDFTSKDREQIENFIRCLGVRLKIGKKTNGAKGSAFRVQLSDVNFFRFLVSVGLFPNKSKTIGPLEIPKAFFFDFLRGHFDGDGTFYSYWDPRWRSSFMFYTAFISASKAHIDWLREMISDTVGIRGHIAKAANNSAYNLRYAKAESLKLLRKLYYDRRVVCLSRKRTKVEKALSAVGIGSIQ